MEVNNSLPIGTILNGLSYTYRIEKALGQGSFGITYLASVKMAGALGAIDTNIKVAIKEFFMRDINGRADSTVTSGSKGGLYDDYRRKFKREALNLSKLQHPNIIKVIESFEANNTVYYVMEYMGGGSLDDYIAKHKGLKEDEAIRIVKQIASALSFMHEKNMLHLDLKPSNIMRKESGDVVLIDYGLSKQYDANGEPESSTKVGGGTPGYAPIEQANYREGKGFPVTMDVYALGATMFKMLTGVRPPEASDILNEGFPLYELQERGISDRISASVAKAMASTKKDRYGSVKSFIDSFEEEGTVIDVDVVTERNKSKEHKTEKEFHVRPNTSKVTFEFHPRTPIVYGAYFCSVDKEQGVDTNVTQESTHIGRTLNEQEYELFLSRVQSLNLKVRDKEVTPYKRLEYSEEPAKLTITLYDENYKVYNKLWISGWNNELGNIEGDIYKIEEQVRKIVPMLQEYIDGPYYEIPNLNKKSEVNKNTKVPQSESSKDDSERKVKYSLWMIVGFVPVVAILIFLAGRWCYMRNDHVEYVDSETVCRDTAHMNVPIDLYHPTFVDILVSDSPNVHILSSSNASTKTKSGDVEPSNNHSSSSVIDFQKIENIISKTDKDSVKAKVTQAKNKQDVVKAIRTTKEIIHMYEKTKVLGGVSWMEAQKKLDGYHVAIKSLMTNLLKDSLSSVARAKAEAIGRLVDKKTAWEIDQPQEGKYRVRRRSKIEIDMQISHLKDLIEILGKDNPE